VAVCGVSRAAQSQGAGEAGRGMSSDLTVRERVKAIQRELLSGDVVPARARELLMTLTSLLGNCQAEVTARDALFTAKLAQCLDEEGKANRARIRAELSDEFAQRQEARNTHALVLELVRSLKVTLRSLEEEMRLAK
jgi:hypothetical protein